MKLEIVYYFLFFSAGFVAEAGVKRDDDDRCCRKTSL